MYKTAVVTGTPTNIGFALKQTIDQINLSGGKIEQIVQSQSSGETYTIITITILYRVAQ